MRGRIKEAVLYFKGCGYVPSVSEFRAYMIDVVGLSSSEATYSNLYDEYESFRKELAKELESKTNVSW